MAEYNSLDGRWEKVDEFTEEAALLASAANDPSLNGAGLRSLLSWASASMDSHISYLEYLLNNLEEWLKQRS